MSQLASVLSGQGNEPLAFQSISSLTGLIVKRTRGIIISYAVQVLGGSTFCQLLVLSNLTPTFCDLCQSLYEFLLHGLLCIYSVIFCRDRSAAAEIWWHRWTSENDDAHLFGTPGKYYWFCWGPELYPSAIIRTNSHSAIRRLLKSSVLLKSYITCISTVTEVSGSQMARQGSPRLHWGQ